MVVFWFSMDIAEAMVEELMKMKSVDVWMKRF
jgi:hypothetical protein